MTNTVYKSDRCKQKLMRTFRVSEQLQEMIEQECERRNTNFSAFIRYAVVIAMHYRARQDADGTS